MCVPGCMEMVAKTISRRGVFKAGVGLTAVAGSAVVFKPFVAQAASMSFSKVVDLTHTITPNFPTYFDKPQLEVEVMFDLKKDGFNVRRWHLVEHTGTHMDAPFHFSEKLSADKLPVETLVAPLCVINIAERAKSDPDTQVTPDDLKAWEGKNGALPDGACVAMNSGWSDHVATDKFRNADDKGMHFPGFHPDATAMLMEKNVVGIAVDTLSLDYGQSKDFKTHYMWLPANRWGLEAVANLGSVPEKGATIVVGSPKIEGATGGPSRVFALM